MTLKTNENLDTWCFTCNHVVDENSQILYASHSKQDGSWQFHCGASNHNETDCKIVSIQDIINLDDSIRSILTMQSGLYCERQSDNQDWSIFTLDSDK